MLCLRWGALPVPCKNPTNWRFHHIPGNPLDQIAIAFAAVIFKPCSVVRILVQILRANEVMLAAYHPAQA